MAIGNCDCCDRIDVPGSVVDCPGEPFACFICQGDSDPDPYCELEEAEEREAEVRAKARAAAIMAKFDAAIEAIKQAVGPL